MEWNRKHTVGTAATAPDITAVLNAAWTASVYKNHKINKRTCKLVSSNWYGAKEINIKNYYVSYKWYEGCLCCHTQTFKVIINQ